MTIVAIWLRHEGPQGAPSIWAVSDSRVSVVGEQPEKLAEAAPKIMTFRSGVFRKDGFERKLEHVARVGYAYAGGGLIGLSTFATASTLFAELLLLSKRGRHPSLVDYSTGIYRVASAYAQQFGLSYPKFACMEGAVFGPCPQSGALVVSHFNIPGEPPRTVDVVGPHSALLLGHPAAKEFVEDEIHRICAREQERTGEWWAAPYRAVERAIDAEVSGTVGGALHVVRMSLRGYSEYATVLSSSSDDARSTARLFGIDFEEDVGGVGDCVLDIPLMATGEWK